MFSRNEIYSMRPAGWQIFFFSQVKKWNQKPHQITGRESYGEPETKLGKG